MSRYFDASVVSVSRKFIMVISEQDLIGLPIDAGFSEPPEQVAFHLLNDLFGQGDRAVGVEEGVGVAGDAAVSLSRQRAGP